MITIHDSELLKTTQKMVTFQVSMPVALIDEIETIAWEEGIRIKKRVSRSSIIRDLCKAGLESWREQKIQTTKP